MFFQYYHQLDSVFLQNNYWMICPGLDDSVFLMSNHLTKDAPQDNPYQPNDAWFTNEKDTKPYIFNHIDNIKFSRSLYIAPSTINYGPYLDNMFPLENFAHTFHAQLITIIN